MKTRRKWNWRKLTIPLLVILLLGVTLGIFIASNRAPLQRQGQVIQTRLAKFCQEGSESSVAYHPSSGGAHSTFDITCRVDDVDFEYASINSNFDKVLKAANLIGDGSSYPDNIVPVLSGHGWIAFTSGNEQTEAEFSGPLEFAQDFLGGTILYYETVNGNPESYSSLADAAIPVCSSNLSSWVSNTAGDALSNIPNDDWITEFGANSVAGTWIQDELGIYARTLVDDGQEIAETSLQNAAQRLCATGNAIQDLSIPAFW
ncbi:MAG: hypothetical protein ABSE75_13470 [Acidimicrobiales bacterium]